MLPLTWEEVALTYGRKIYNFAYRLTGNRADASDLAQEVLAAGEAWVWPDTNPDPLKVGCGGSPATRSSTRSTASKRRPTIPLPDEPDRMAQRSRFAGA